MPSAHKQLFEDDYEIMDDSVWLGMGDFSIRVLKTKNGMITEIYARGCETDEPLATANAFDEDALDIIERNKD